MLHLRKGYFSMINYNQFNFYGETIAVGADRWKGDVLSSDPFMGDFGEGRILSDKIVKTRTTLILCSSCLSTCEKGTYNRVITESSEGELIRNRFCQNCCTNMGYDELCLIDGKTKLTTLDEDDDEDEDIRQLDDQLYKLRDNHEKALIAALGGRWFESPSEVQYQVISQLYD